jgi:hypothetical protein
MMSTYQVSRYTPEINQRAMAAIAGALQDEKELNGFLRVSWSNRLVRRGSQLFAAFRAMAYDVTPFAVDDDGGAATYEPVITDDGRMIRQSPDEGNEGVLMHVHITRRHSRQVDRHQLTFVPLGWIWTEELDQSNEQISQNIADEAETTRLLAEFEHNERKKRGLD